MLKFRKAWSAYKLGEKKQLRFPPRDSLAQRGRIRAALLAVFFEGSCGSCQVSQELGFVCERMIDQLLEGKGLFSEAVKREESENIVACLSLIGCTYRPHASKLIKQPTLPTSNITMI